MSTRNIFYDTEFLEDGHTIDLISIGMVCDDGTEYYAVNADCNFDRVKAHDWLWENVVPSLPTVVKQPPKSPLDGIVDPNVVRRYLGIPIEQVQMTKLDRNSALVKPKWVIANEVREFITCHYDMGDTPLLWANYASFDHVALAWLYGPMSELPPGVPMRTNDIQQLLDWLPSKVRQEMAPQASVVHNALEDARYNRYMFDYAMEYLSAERDDTSGQPGKAQPMFDYAMEYLSAERDDAPGQPGKAQPSVGSPRTDAYGQEL